MPRYTAVKDCTVMNKKCRYFSKLLFIINSELVLMRQNISLCNINNYQSFNKHPKAHLSTSPSGICQKCQMAVCHWKALKWTTQYRYV
jgi:hypothetical protein